MQSSQLRQALKIMIAVFAVKKQLKHHLLVCLTCLHLWKSRKAHGPHILPASLSVLATFPLSMRCILNNIKSVTLLRTQIWVAFHQLWRRRGIQCLDGGVGIIPVTAAWESRLWRQRGTSLTAARESKRFDCGVGSLVVARDYWLRRGIEKLMLLAFKLWLRRGRLFQ